MELGPVKVLYPGLWGLGRLEGYPVTGDIGSPFGPRNPINTPQGPTSSFHNGVDIAAPKGTPIFAPCDFVVTFSGTPLDGTATNQTGQGMFGRLADGSGIGFWHMEGLQLDLGHVVRRGDIIGQVGSSGYSTGPHLHFMRLAVAYDNQSWYAYTDFTDPLLDFVETITVGTVVEEPQPLPAEPDLLLSFIENSLQALRINPPADYGVALIELQRRVEYLRSLLS